MEVKMDISNLAEAIILQSIEDLWNRYHREDCIKFFAGREFNMCARMAGMNSANRIKLINMVSGSINGEKRPVRNMHIDKKNLKS